MKVARITGRVAFGTGRSVRLKAGDQFPDDDPIVKARPELFESPESYVARTRKPRTTAELGSRSMSARKMIAEQAEVEQATAAPGEKRDVKRAKREG
ncbi:MAG TPA: hypothetical protein VNU01_00880 [Egibacteraceae bacterium]|nr:hypothetical protein [Egibacteraceae bacterium]